MSKIVLGLAAVLAGVLLMAKKAGAGGGCFLAEPLTFYTVTWRGKSTNLPDAFGSAWAHIFTVEYFDVDESGEWDPPADPENTTIHKNETIRFKLQSAAEVCGFEIEA